MTKKKKIDVSPYIIKQSSQEGKFKSDDSGFGADVYSKYGNVGINKTKNKKSFDGGDELETTSKNLTYGKNFKIGDSSSLTLEGNYGKSKNKFLKSDTKGGKITFTKSFSEGGVARGGGAAIRGTGFKGVF